jgi:hypothetical protein
MENTSSYEQQVEAAVQKIDDGDCAGALADLDALLAEHPTAMVHMLRWAALRSLGRASEAEEAKRRGVELDPAVAAKIAKLVETLESRSPAPAPARTRSPATGRASHIIGFLVFLGLGFLAGYGIWRLLPGTNFLFGCQTTDNVLMILLISGLADVGLIVCIRGISPSFPEELFIDSREDLGPFCGRLEFLASLWLGLTSLAFGIIFIIAWVQWGHPYLPSRDSFKVIVLNGLIALAAILWGVICIILSFNRRSLR